MKIINKLKTGFGILGLVLCASTVHAQQDTYIAPNGTMYTHPNASMAVFGNLINDAQGGVNHNNGGDVYLYRDAAAGTGNSRIYDGPLAPAPTDNYNAGGAYVRFYNILTDNTVGTATPSGTNINSTSGTAPIQIEQEARVTNTHTFVNGMLWTPRADWKHAYMHYESTGNYTGTSDAKHIDGYAASTNKATFDYPIGEGTRLRISGVVGAANGTFKSAYFQKNAQLGTTGISGNNASTGPMNGGIQVVNTTEFWDIDGTASSQFKLTALNSVAGYSDWNIGANFSGLQASDMVITAFDPWENLGITGTPGTITADGAFVTTVATTPDVAFSAYTWANKVPVIIANPDISQTVADAPVSGDLSTNDDVPSGSTFSPLGSPPNGTITMNPDGTYTYTPDPNFVGTDSVQYTVCAPSPSTQCDTTWLSVVVSPISTPTGTNTTIAQTDVATTPANTSVDICVTCNDSDPQNNTQGTPSIIGTPHNGTATVNPDGTVSYTPDPNFTGVDSFYYTICDDGTPQACDTAQVIVNVPNIAAATNQTYANDDANSGPMDTPMSGNVSGNDTDPQSGDNQSFTQVTNPTNGTLVFNPDGSYTYTPTVGYIGPDQFTYSVCDNGTPQACDTATVYLSVHGEINADPDISQTTVNTPVTGDISTNDEVPAGSTFTPLGTPPNGTVTMNTDGTYTYAPDPGFEGTDSVQYIVCAPTPNGTLCDTTTLTIEIRDNVIDPATNTTIAQNDQATTPPGTTVNICVTCNDSDPESNTQANPTLASTPTNGTVTILADGTIDYTPNPGFSGTDVFTYSVCDDGSPVACDTATVVVTVPNVSPTDNQTYANDDANSTPMDTPVSGDVSGNDTDPQSGDTHVFTKLTNPTNGTVVFNPDGTYTYTPTVGYVGPDQFTYNKCDDGTPQACEEATVYLTVFGLNAPLPVELISFNVINNDCKALVTWATASENHADYIQVMRKEGNGSFEAIGRVAAIGNSTIENQYSFVDHHDFKKGVQYQYKLKLVDIDGQYAYSEIDNLAFNCSLSNGTISIFPNPATDNLNIILSDVAQEGILNFKIYNALGQVVHASKIIKDKEEVYTQTIDVQGLANGVYHLSIVGDNTFNKTEKVLIK